MGHSGRRNEVERGHWPRQQCLISRSVKMLTAMLVVREVSGEVVGRIDEWSSSQLQISFMISESGDAQGFLGGAVAHRHPAHRPKISILTDSKTLTAKRSFRVVELGCLRAAAPIAAWSESRQCL
jgi:hypothetical protein